MNTTPDLDLIAEALDEIEANYLDDRRDRGDFVASALLKARPPLARVRERDAALAEKIRLALYFLGNDEAAARLELMAAQRALAAAPGDKP